MERRWVILSIIAGILLWLACLGCFGFVWSRLFVTDLDVVNDSGEDLRITPIGMWQGSGQYGPLPRFDNRVPFLPSRNWSDLPQAAGTRITIHYCWDDINFRHILIRKTSGELLILDTDKRGNLHECWTPKQSEYRIPPLDDLATAPDELIPCAGGSPVTYSGMKEY